MLESHFQILAQSLDGHYMTKAMGYKPKGDLLMNHYETLFVVKATLTQEEIDAQIEKIKSVLNAEGAELLATNNMGMRKLAYAVEKNLRGYYAVLYFNAKGETIAELERNLKINEDVIKFLTIKYSNTKEVAQFNKLVDAANKSVQVAEKVETPAEETAPAEAAATETTDEATVSEAAEETPATETAEA